MLFYMLPELNFQGSIVPDAVFYGLQLRISVSAALENFALLKNTYAGVYTYFFKSFKRQSLLGLYLHPKILLEILFCC